MTVTCFLLMQSYAKGLLKSGTVSQKFLTRKPHKDDSWGLQIWIV